MFSLHLSTHQRWDIAGIDGLAVAKTLFGESVNHIAPFQSLETHLNGMPCSVLRLCEGNFRVSGHSAELAQINQLIPINQRVWVKQLDWLSAIVIPEAIGLSRLTELAIAKPPYRLSSLAVNCAVPARIQGIAVLVWRHSVQEQPAFELHLATADLNQIQAEFQE
ncbi:MAG: hypothetical protein Kow00121_24740 [Elainellaceae cyanobacterium]